MATFHAYQLGKYTILTEGRPAPAVADPIQQLISSTTRVFTAINHQIRAKIGFYTQFYTSYFGLTPRFDKFNRLIFKNKVFNVLNLSQI